MLPPECFFCCSESDDCKCSQEEFATKTALLNFFIDALKEFAPRKAKAVDLYQGVDFVNEWFSRFLSEREKD